jgi:hypothetical protein
MEPEYISFLTLAPLSSLLTDIGNPDPQRKRPRLGSDKDKEHESAEAILALAKAAETHAKAESQSEATSEDMSGKKRGYLESDMPSTPARAYASSLGGPQGSESERGIPDEASFQSFPQKLMEMLDTRVVPEAMWWADKGKAFAMDLNKFEQVLHQHFQSAKYARYAPLSC